jgi:hypothetical protein
LLIHAANVSKLRTHVFLQLEMGREAAMKLEVGARQCYTLIANILAATESVRGKRSSLSLSARLTPGAPRMLCLQAVEMDLANRMRRGELVRATQPVKTGEVRHPLSFPHSHSDGGVVGVVAACGSLCILLVQ